MSRHIVHRRPKNNQALNEHNSARHAHRPDSTETQPIRTVEDEESEPAKVGSEASPTDSPARSTPEE